MGMTNDGLSYWQAETDGEPLLEITIGDLLDLRAQEHPAKEALVYSCYPEFGGALDIRWTYAEYRERVNAVARGLMALGLNKGDHIAIWAANLPEWPLIQLAAAKIGLVLVTINPILRAAEVEYILKQGDVDALFFMARIRDHDCLATIRSLTTPGAKYGEVTGERLPRLRYVSLLGAPPTGLLEQEGWRPTIFREMAAGGAQVSAEALKERQATVTPSDPAMILYTSGTTGFPKGAVLSHLAVINNGWVGGKRLGFDENLRGCVLVPFFHVFGSVGFVLGALSIGGTIHPLIAFDTLKALQVISSERCTYTGGVPTMLFAMLQHPDFNKYDLSSLKVVLCAGAPVPVFLMEDVKKRIGADVAIAFGQTENAGSFTLTFPDDPFELKAATVGVPQAYVDVKIIDPATGQVVPCGERGEICCRGYLVMQGYYNMPEKTAQAIDSDGWLHTGDLATMDARGYVNIVGRLKDCKDQISRQKIPRYFQFVTSYPMTGSGKVQKFVLRENAIKALGLEEAGNIRTA